MKKLITVFTLLFSLFVRAQDNPPSSTYTPIMTTGYDELRMRIRALHLPSGGATPTLAPKQWLAAGAVFVDTINDKLYLWSSGGWHDVTGGGGAVTGSKSVAVSLNNVTLVNDSTILVNKSVYSWDGTTRGWHKSVNYNPVGLVAGHQIIDQDGSGYNLTNSPQDGLCTRLIDPITVSKVGVLLYYVSPGWYKINCIAHYWAGGNIQLAVGTALPGEFRKDFIIMKITGADTLKGENSVGGIGVDPVADPDNEIVLAGVRIDEDEIDDSQITSTVLWHEGYSTGDGYWKRTATVDSAYTSIVHGGTYSFRLFGATNGQYFELDNRFDVQLNKNNYTNFQFWGYNVSALNVNRTINVTLRLGNVQAPGTNSVNISNWGYLRNTLGQWLPVNIPMSAFGGTPFFNGIRFTDAGTGGVLNVLFDDFNLQNGITGVSVPINPDGNFGNIQLNRFNQFRTPANDSLTVDQNILKVKHDVRLGEVFGTSTAKVQIRAKGYQPLLNVGPWNYNFPDYFGGLGVWVDTAVTANDLKAVGFGWNRESNIAANGVSLSFNYGGNINWLIRLKDSTRFSNQNNDAIAGLVTGMEFRKATGQTARSVVLSGAIPYDHSSGVLSQLQLIGGTTANNYKMRGNYAGFIAYPISDNPNHTDSMDNYTGFFAGGGGAPLGIKIRIYRGMLSTPGGGDGSNIEYYYGAYLSGAGAKTSRFYNSGSGRFGGSQATTILLPGDDTARFGARLDIDGKLAITDGTQCAGCVFMSDANGLGHWQDSTGLFPGSAVGGGNTIYTADDALTGDRVVNAANHKLYFDQANQFLARAHNSQNQLYIDETIASMSSNNTISAKDYTAFVQTNSAGGVPSAIQIQGENVTDGTVSKIYVSGNGMVFNQTGGNYYWYDLGFEAAPDSVFAIKNGKVVLTLAGVGGGSNTIYSADDVLAGDRTVGLGGHTLTIGGSAFLQMNDATIAAIGYGDNQIEVTSAGLNVRLDGTNVFTYNANYAANFTARSLTDKGYVDGVAGSKVNITDTAGAFNNYRLGMIANTAGLLLKFNLSDTAAAHNPYRLGIIANAAGLLLKFNLSDSANAFNPYRLGMIANTANLLTKVGQTLTTTASSATPTPTGDAIINKFTLTALATAPTFAVPSGTPADGNELLVRIKDNGTARVLAFNAIYRAGADLSLPTTTIISKTMYLKFVYNSASSTWDFVSYLDNF